MRSIGFVITLFGASGFILPQIMRNPPFWDALNNDAPKTAGVILALGIVIVALSYIFRRKRANEALVGINGSALRKAPACEWKS